MDGRSLSPRKNQGAAADDEDSDGDEGAYCNICMEPWTNSGAHRISSLRIGIQPCRHLFVTLNMIMKALMAVRFCPKRNTGVYLPGVSAGYRERFFGKLSMSSDPCLGCR